MASRRILIPVLTALVVVAAGCGDDASQQDPPASTPDTSAAAPSTTTPPPSTSGGTASAATTTVAVAVVEVDAEVELTLNAPVRIAGTEIVIELIEAHAPDDDCSDCPLQATLAVTNRAETADLQYSFGGMMEQSALEAARRRQAFGFAFVAIKIADDEMTVVVGEGG